MQAEVDGWLKAAEAADAAETRSELPDWVADKQARLAKIREAKAELEAEAKTKAAPFYNVYDFRAKPGT